ncbi:hypothetical protein M2165_003782 [Variovorax sp. TBS-050B]|uniref:hypothetical protein n=1 Tax=Variovorax sp. TBS-050B TaxID=2940551 RepID=UPI0024747800|nr:hypothetical protein [Variovorax sp. TBS-050B]MDH6593893.1 hypothetical protein [Variovorax sp. TBS-050B]
MPMINCAQHGWREAELTTAAVSERVAEGGAGPERVVLLDLNWDGVSFPLAALDSELPLPETELKDGNLGTDDAEVFDTVLGTLQPVCSCCLHTIVEVGAGGDCDCR